MVLLQSLPACHHAAHRLPGTRAGCRPSRTTMEDAQPTTDQDEELVHRIAGGDQQALSDFYDRHARTLLAVAVRILDDASLAEDVVQEAFLQVWEKAPAFDRTLGRPLGWAVVITRNKAIDRLRARQRGHRLVERAAAESADPDPGDPPPGDQDRAEHLHGALAELPADQRTAIELAFFRGMTQVEIAETLDAPLGTIKARIRRGMLRLRDKLQGIL